MVGKATHCQRGHPWDEANSRYSNLPNGTIVRRCKACARAGSLRWIKNEYRNNPDYRARHLARSNAYNNRKRDEQIQTRLTPAQSQDNRSPKPVPRPKKTPPTRSQGIR